MQISPMTEFDQIRQFDDNHQEFWSARDLQDILGYEKWERFEDTIIRAKTACQNSEKDPNDHFLGGGKVMESGRWGKVTVSDYHLTRYAAYLVAMNGDPRKPEIAAAQTYFAIKTREAELKPAQMVLPQNYLDALKQLVASVETTQKLEQENAVLTPKAEAFDALVNTQGAESVGAVAKVLGTGRDRLFAFMRDQGLIFGTEPYQRYVEQGLFQVRLGKRRSSSGEEVVTKTTLITPKGAEYLRRLRAKNAQPQNQLEQPRNAERLFA